MKPRLIYISKNYRHLGKGGDKAKTDVEAIMSGLGYVNVGLPQSRSTNNVTAFVRTLFSVLKGTFGMRRGDVLVIQYPLKKYYDFVVRMARKRGVRVITLIHDLGSFRRKKLSVTEEVERLNRSSVLIIHSRAMEQWLRDNGVTVPFVRLGLWDFLSDAAMRKQHTPDGGRFRLTFGGDLSPRANGWIYKLAKSEPDVDLVLYGKGFDSSQKTGNIIEKGFSDADSIIPSCEGDYGIVWYGSELDDSVGPLGEYLRYNAPHKTSLYIRAGLPLIIWENAGLADIVTDLGIGITVPTLKDIGERLAQVTPEQYSAMCANVAKTARSLAHGEFITQALARSLALLPT